MNDKNPRVIKKIQKTFAKMSFPNIEVSLEGDVVHLEGSVDSWDDVVRLGYQAGKFKGVGEVVNNVKAKGVVPKKETRQKKKLTTKIYPPKLPKKADVVVVGGGVVGCCIARELSRYNLEVVLLEKEWDVGMGASKANSAQVHTGIGEDSGTLKKELCAKSWPMYEKLTEELDVPYLRNGLLVVMTKDTFSGKMPSFVGNFLSKYLIPPFVVRKGKIVGDKPRVVKRKELLEMEPNLTPRALVGVFHPGYALVCPFRLTIALAENAIQNGAKVFLDTEVTGVLVEDKKVEGVVTNRGMIEASFVINAAGVFSDDVAAMAGAKEFTIHPRKGVILLFDKEMESYITHQVSLLKFPRDPHTKGGAVLMTVDGNINWGPSAVEIPDKNGREVSKEEIDWVFEKYSSALPNFPKSSIIKFFSGIRAPTYKEDFYIKPAKNVRGFVNVAGIQSPGLTAAPAIAELALDILREQGLEMEEKEDFNPVREGIPIFEKLSSEKKREQIEQNPLYGKIVCRCEHVTEGEIVDAIHSPLPAVTVDAVKYRTRAGSGRCQAGFCGPRVARILARELGISEEEVMQKGDGSNLFMKSKVRKRGGKHA